MSKNDNRKPGKGNRRGGRKSALVNFIQEAAGKLASAIRRDRRQRAARTRLERSFRVQRDAQSEKEMATLTGVCGAEGATPENLTELIERAEREDRMALASKLRQTRAELIRLVVTYNKKREDLSRNMRCDHAESVRHQLVAQAADRGVSLDAIERAAERQVSE